ncbi:rhodanese-like domain-containing protein [Terrisporobacter sp.]|uniref:rhodanese-like domain-containing protein n=1 Tax=Terrisporobacter sp. TaxID=1965305 RepID=UPI002615E8AC|nr:rhodanese-like domain-containing protein [Terrisporobacter sp.]
MSIYENISSEELNNMIEKDKNILLLDVRTKEEYNTMHIPNSINIPLQDLEIDLDNILSYTDKDVIIYCRSGKRSITAAYILEENGFKHIYNLTYGIIGYLDYLDYL